MRLTAHEIVVDGRHDQLVPPTSLQARSGQCTYIACDQDRSTALGLALTGRLPLSGGQIDFTSEDPGSLAEISALIDAPDVSAPIHNLKVKHAAGEALAIAGRKSNAAAVRQWLTQHDLDGLADRYVETLAGPERVALLTSLAIARKHVRLLVIDTPDRHRGDLHDWSRIAQHYAHNGYAVVVICDQRSIDLLGVPAYRIGATELPPSTPANSPAESSPTISE